MNSSRDKHHSPGHILSVRNLQISIEHSDEKRNIIKDLSLEIPKGQTVALLGESGSGKTLVANSIIGNLPEPAAINSGEIFFKKQDLLTLSQREMRNFQGNKIGMIYQEPSKFLNPLMQVGKQIGETLRTHNGLGRKDAKQQTLALMALVGIADPKKRYNHYPHQLSGGAKQRVTIASALACRPDLLLADEPTSALDLTVQAQILDLLERLINDLEMSVLLISHDFGIISTLADKIVVLLGGRQVESGNVKDVLTDPAHPYTQSLMDPSKIAIGNAVIQTEKEREICPFINKCPYVKPMCKKALPTPINISSDRLVSCFLHGGNTEDAS